VVVVPRITNSPAVAIARARSASSPPESVGTLAGGVPGPRVAVGLGEAVAVEVAVGVAVGVSVPLGVGVLVALSSAAGPTIVSSVAQLFSESTSQSDQTCP
jgi:hypothetical protein